MSVVLLDREVAIPEQINHVASTMWWQYKDV